MLLIRYDGAKVRKVFELWRVLTGILICFSLIPVCAACEHQNFAADFVNLHLRFRIATIISVLVMLLT